MSTRQHRKAATRQSLKDAALVCFAEHGLHETSIGMITRAAGVAHGTFYVHYATKEAVLDDLLDDFNAAFTARLLPVVTATDRALPEALRAVAEAFLDHWQAHRGFIEAYAQRVAAGLSLVALRDGLSQTMVEVVAAWLVAVAARSGGTLDAPTLVAQALLAMWFRLGLQHLFNSDVGREQAVDLLARMTHGALAAIVPELAGSSLPTLDATTP